MGKTDRIILIDADVISHFITANEIIALPTIFPYRIKILDKVYNELLRFPKRKTEVENLLRYKLIDLIEFPEENDTIKKEYFYIKKVLFKGDGESACLAVARYNKNILASSNLKDIKSYCTMHKIDYLATMDFLCEALNNGIFDMQRCNDFVSKVIKSGSKLPVIKMENWQCRKLSV